MGKKPALSTDLIRELDRLYPEKCPDPNWSDRKIWMYAGARGIVRGLVAKVKTESADEIHTTNERSWFVGDVLGPDIPE